MKRIILNIVSVLLLIVFPLTAVGIDINYHICKSSNNENVSLFVEKKCEHESEPKESCCETEVAPKSCCEDEVAECNDESDGEGFNQVSCCSNTVQRIAIEDTFTNPDIIKINFSVLSGFVYHIDLQKSTSFKINSKIKDIVYYGASPPTQIIHYIQTTSNLDSDSPSAV